MSGYFVTYLDIHFACSIFVEYVNTLGSKLVTATEIPAIDNINLHKLQEIPRNRIDRKVQSPTVDIASPLHSCRFHKRTVGESDINNCRVFLKALGKGITSYLRQSVLHIKGLKHCFAGQIIDYKKVFLVETHIVPKHILVLAVYEKRTDYQCNRDKVLNGNKGVAQTTTGCRCMETGQHHSRREACDIKCRIYTCRQPGNNSYRRNEQSYMPIFIETYRCGELLYQLRLGKKGYKHCCSYKCDKYKSYSLGKEIEAQNQCRCTKDLVCIYCLYAHGDECKE